MGTMDSIRGNHLQYQSKRRPGLRYNYSQFLRFYLDGPLSLVRARRLISGPDGRRNGEGAGCERMASLRLISEVS